jgi:hypothetical protein
MNPLNLPWWEWLVVWFVAATICAIAAYISGNREGNSCLATFCLVGGGLTAVVAFFIAVIRFAEWAWSR